MQIKYILLLITVILIFGCSNARLSDAIQTFNEGVNDLLDWRSRDDAKIELAEDKFEDIAENEISQLYLGAIYGLYRVSKGDATWTGKSISVLNRLKSDTDDANIKGHADELIGLIKALDAAYNHSIVDIDAVTEDIKELLSDFGKINEK